MRFSPHATVARIWVQGYLNTSILKMHLPRWSARQKERRDISKQFGGSHLKYLSGYRKAPVSS